MSTIYVDLSNQTGGTGTSGDPYGVDDFISNLNTANAESDDTYLVKGTGTYSCSNTITAVKIGNKSSYSVTIQSWEDAPAQLTIQMTRSNGASNNYYGIAYENGGCGGLSINRMCIEIKAVVTSGGITNFKAIGSGAYTGSTISILNSYIAVNTDTTPTGEFVIYGYSGDPDTFTHLVKGCDLVNLTTIPMTSYVDIIAHGASSFTLDSCYFEGPAASVLNFESDGFGTWTGSYRNIATYNNISYETFYVADSITISEGPQNQLYPSQGSKIANATYVSTLDVDTDLNPENALRVGNKLLGLTYDIRNVVRGATPWIGCMEYLASTDEDTTTKTSGITVLDIIKQAMQTIGALAISESVPTDDANTCMFSLNAVLDQWKTEKLMAYYIENDLYELPDTTGEYTVGESGSADLEGTRPLKILNAFIRDSSSNDHQLEIVSNNRFQEISSKSTTAGIPTTLLYKPTYEDGTIYLHPIPTDTVSLNISYWKLLDEFTSLSQVIVLPPGFRQALVWNLACEIYPKFNRVANPPAFLLKRASECKANIMNLNGQDEILACDNAITGGGAYNIYTDE